MATVKTGRIVSTGATTYLPIPTGFDKIEVTNATIAAAAGANSGMHFAWQRGMAQGSALQIVKQAVTEAMIPGAIATGGFTEYNSSDDPVGPLNSTITAVSNAAIPVVSATDTDDLVAGDVVRLINVTGAQQLGGIDFSIDTVVLNTSFRLPHMAQIAAGTTGSFRKIKYAPMFYPATRTISKVATGATTLITMTVAHDYKVGQKVKFVVPAAFDMVQLNGLEGEITAINVSDGASTNTITVDINSSAFTAFAWPLTTDGEFTPAQVIPAGKATDYASKDVDVATYNTATMGVILAAGVNSPAGVANDVLYYTITKND
jgi:hypothetical protein